MCGIAGLIRSSQVREEDVELIKEMNQIQKHRGPDDEGLYFDQRCVLGHRRLSIIDLSSAGHQPFESEDGRYKIIFNGEIYNYIELRDELKAKGCRFKTKTDTEVLLQAYLHFKEGCLNKLNGMFAFCVYDSKENTLFLARDRFGIKPLYYVLSEGTLYFASEIKALKNISYLKRSINHQAIFDYLVFNRTDIFDETFVNEIKRLPKGHYARFVSGQLILKQWWNPKQFLNQQHDVSYDEILKTIKNILISSAQIRLRSDVPVGSCLSGGLDSTILTGILYQHNALTKDYKTFSATFPDYAFDETRYVDTLKRKYPFANHQTSPTADQVFQNLDKFVYAQDEPTASTATYAQYEVMRLAKQQGVVVLMDGQGGDENFAGYHYFHGFFTYGLWKQKRYARFLNELLNSIFRGQKKDSYQTLGFQMAPSNVKKSALYQRHSHLNRDFFDHHVDQSKIFNEFFNATSLNDSIVKHFQYKLEHLLRFEDRSSMAFSIEARLPYLDYRLVEFLLGIKDDIKIKGGVTKDLQRKAVGSYTTSEILNRKDKAGFETPASDWMKTKAWDDLAQRSFVTLKKDLKHIYQNEATLPSGAQERWKTVQLNTWHNQLQRKEQAQCVVS